MTTECSITWLLCWALNHKRDSFGQRVVLNSIHSQWNRWSFNFEPTISSYQPKTQSYAQEATFGLHKSSLYSYSLKPCRHFPPHTHSAASANRSEADHFPRRMTHTRHSPLLRSRRLQTASGGWTEGQVGRGSDVPRRTHPVPVQYTRCTCTVSQRRSERAGGCWCCS